MTSGLSEVGSSVAGMDELTDAEKAVLAFERGRWNYQGAKEGAIWKTFEMTPVRYQQWLFAILDKPAALVHDPSLVKRLRRLRSTREAMRRHPAGRQLHPT